MPTLTMGQIIETETKQQHNDTKRSYDRSQHPDGLILQGDSISSSG